MTTVTGDVAVGAGVDPSTLGTQKSYLVVTPVEMVTTGTGVTMLPIPSRHEIATDGTFSISVDPLPTGFAYEFVFHINGGQYVSPSRICTVPSSGTVQFKNLPDVTPPNHGGWGPPGWVAEILAIIASGGIGGGGGGTWGSIVGSLANQLDLAQALALRATLASPALTGTPTVPTAAPGTNSAQAASTAFVSAAIANLISSAPGALDTLDELAAALGDDPNFAATITNLLAQKAPLNNPTFTGTVGGLTKAMVGLGNADNTSDANKPVSAAQAAAIAAVNPWDYNVRPVALHDGIAWPDRASFIPPGFPGFIDFDSDGRTEEQVGFPPTAIDGDGVWHEGS